MGGERSKSRGLGGTHMNQKSWVANPPPAISFEISPACAQQVPIRPSRKFDSQIPDARLRIQGAGSFWKLEL